MPLRRLNSIIEWQPLQISVIGNTANVGITTVSTPGSVRHLLAPRETPVTVAVTSCNLRKAVCAVPRTRPLDVLQHGFNILRHRVAAPGWGCRALATCSHGR